MRRWLAALCGATAAVALAAVATGCGLGAGRGTGDVTLTVTRGFGTQPVAAVSERTVPGAETVMRMLQAHFQVSTRYGGGFVESINGLSGDGARHDWFYYVNGVEAGKGAASTAVHRGDRIWWDLHDWSQTDSIPAVVGSFPEPFLHGFGGKRLPTVVECGMGQDAACGRVQAALRRVGVPVATQLLGTGSGSDSLAVLVGTWQQLRPTIAGALLARGPGRSGVYARFSGGSLQLLDAGGRVARTLGAGAGLVAATRDTVSQPVWMITGTDSGGVAAAAGLLSPARLHDHFAVAARAGAAAIPVPAGAGA